MRTTTDQARRKYRSAQHFRRAVNEGLESRRLLSGLVPTSLIHFDNYDGPGETNSVPAAYAGLTELNGVLFGTAAFGGASDDGFVFSVKTTTHIANAPLATFNGTNGSDPEDGFTAVGNLLYCATDGNTISKFNPTGDTLTAVAHLPSIGSNSDSPDNTMLNVGGMLYGETTAGGAHNTGFLYQFNPATNAVTTLYSFTGSQADNGPAYGTLLDVGGSLYGTAQGNGAHGDGYIFQYNLASKTFTNRFSFNGTDGSAPQGGLIDVGGDLYGTASTGGTQNNGTLFQFNPSSGALTTLASFPAEENGYNTLGANPTGTLTDYNGQIYGALLNGGENTVGAIFVYNPSTKKVSEFAHAGGYNGFSPNGELLFVNGVMYGTTQGLSGVEGVAGGGSSAIAIFPPTTIQLTASLHNITLRIDPSNTNDLEVLNGSSKYEDLSLGALSAVNVVGDSSVPNSVKVDYTQGFFPQVVSITGSGSQNSLSIVDGPNAFPTTGGVTTTWTFGSGTAVMSEPATGAPGLDANDYDPTINFTGVQNVSFFGRTLDTAVQGVPGENIVVENTPHAGITLPTLTTLNITSSDNVAIQGTASPLTVVGAGTATSNGDVVVIGSNAPSLGGTLANILSPVTVNNVSDIVADDSGDSASTTGTISATSITGFGLPSSSKITYASKGGLQVHGGANVNTETVTGTSTTTTLYPGATDAAFVTVKGAASPLTIDGNNHVDFIDVGDGNLSGITGSITVTSTNPISTLSVDDSSDTTNRTGTIAATSVTGFGMGSSGAVNYTGNQIHSLYVYGGAGSNTETVKGTSTPTTLTPGAKGSTTLNITATASPLTINGNDLVDYITVGSLAPSLGGTLSGITAPITITNTSAYSTLTLDDSGDKTFRDATLTPTTISGLGMGSGAKVTYTGSGLQSLTLRGGKKGADLTETGTSCPVTLVGITKV